MAKGNMFLGMSRGSVGDVTFYRNHGQQVARVRNRKPMNPKTEAQVIQRMILATASKAYSRMKGIVDHSFQGVQYGGVSQSYFLKRAMDDIRTWVSQTIDITGEYPENLRNPLLYRGLAFPTGAHQSGVGLLISEGSIPTVEATTTTAEGADPIVTQFGSNVSSTASIANVLDGLGAQAGDQITVIGLIDTGSFLASRYVIRADASVAELSEEWDSSIDGAAFDAKKSSLSLLTLVNNAGKLMPFIPSRLGSLWAGAVIISRKVGDVWQRSTQRLVWLLDAGDYSTTDIVAAEWMAGTTPIDTVNPRYLNQAEQV